MSVYTVICLFVLSMSGAVSATFDSDIITTKCADELYNQIVGDKSLHCKNEMNSTMTSCSEREMLPLIGQNLTQAQYDLQVQFARQRYSDNTALKMMCGLSLSYLQAPQKLCNLDTSSQNNICLPSLIATLQNVDATVDEICSGYQNTSSCFHDYIINNCGSGLAEYRAVSSHLQPDACATFCDVSICGSRVPSQALLVHSNGMLCLFFVMVLIALSLL